MPTGGLLQGDRLQACINLEQGTQVHITTQSVSKVYRMDKNYASQITNIHVGKGAFLEYYPDALLLQKGSRYSQKTRLVVHDDATVIYGEIVLPGRVASGELFDYEIYHSDLLAEYCNGKPRFRESLLLEPEQIDVTRQGMLGHWKVFGNFYVINKTVNLDQLSDEVHDILQDQEGILGGCSLLPSHDGIVVRILGQHHRKVKTTMDQVWGWVRQKLISTPLPQIRK